MEMPRHAWLTLGGLEKVSDWQRYTTVDVRRLFFLWLAVPNVSSLSFLTHTSFLWMCSRCKKKRVLCMSERWRVFYYDSHNEWVYQKRSSANVRYADSCNGWLHLYLLTEHTCNNCCNVLCKQFIQTPSALSDINAHHCHGGVPIISTVIGSVNSVLIIQVLVMFLFFFYPHYSSYITAHTSVLATYYFLIFTICRLDKSAVNVNPVKMAVSTLRFVII